MDKTVRLVQRSGGDVAVTMVVIVFQMRLPTALRGFSIHRQINDWLNYIFGPWI